MFSILLIIILLIVAVTEIVLFIVYFDPLMEILEEMFKEKK